MWLGFWPWLGNDLAFLIAWFLSPAAQASLCTDVLFNVYSHLVGQSSAFRNAIGDLIK